MKCIDDKIIDRKQDVFAIKALLRAYKEYGCGSLFSMRNSPMCRFKHVDDLYKKCVSSRKTHSNESHYQNMAYWVGDAALPYNAKLSKDFLRDYLVLYTFVYSPSYKIAQSDIISIKSCIKHMSNRMADGGVSNESKKKTIQYLMGLSTGQCEIAILAADKLNKHITNDKEKLNISKKQSEAMVEISEKVSANPQLYEKLPL